MSLGLAISKVAFYTIMTLSYTQKISELEGQIPGALNNPKLQFEIQSQLNIFKTLLRMFKDFLEFWKEVIKNFLAMLKLFDDIIRK